MTVQDWLDLPTSRPINPVVGNYYVSEPLKRSVLEKIELGEV